MIKSEDYLNKCLSYVNFNALKHWLVGNVFEWPFSSIFQLNWKRVDTKYVLRISNKWLEFSLTDNIMLPELEF